MEPSTLKTIADALRVSIYAEHKSDPTLNAQRNLEDRTHYVDPATLRFHKSRIRSARPVLEGAFFKLTESVATTYDGSKRGFRVVVIDLCGNIVYRPSLDECCRTADAAEVDYWAWLGDFDPIAHYRQVMIDRAARMATEIADLNTAIAAI